MRSLFPLFEFLSFSTFPFTFPFLQRHIPSLAVLFVTCYYMEDGRLSDLIFIYSFGCLLSKKMGKGWEVYSLRVGACLLHHLSCFHLISFLFPLCFFFTIAVDDDIDTGMRERLGGYLCFCYSFSVSCFSAPYSLFPFPRWRGLSPSFFFPFPFPFPFPSKSPTFPICLIWVAV
jgi:hypothetical protein